MPTKICRVTKHGAELVRADGKTINPVRIYVREDVDNPVPGEFWLYAEPISPLGENAPPIDPKDMTDEQIAADPMFQLIKRAEKALRTFGPTSKRPRLDTTDKGFCYVDNTLNVTIWWYGSNWRDAMGAIR